jgi:branched-chain amino acid transport system permease protein
VDQILINLLNGLSSGLLLFMLSSGLTLIFSMMGVLNFAHASFYMVGAYLAYTVAGLIGANVPGDLGFTISLFVAPLLAGALGALFERTALRRVHKFGHVPELLITFGLTYVVGEVVALVWGRSPLTFEPPTWLQGPAFTIVQSAATSASHGLSLALGAAPAEVCNAAGAACSRFPMTRAFMAMVALGMLVALWLLLTRTRIGLVIQAALTHPEMAEALGHNVPRVFMLVFGGGCALAGLAGVIGGVTFVTEPNMANIGPIIFAVIVIGGMGSLSGAFVGSLLVGLLQTLPLTVDASAADLINRLGGHAAAGDLAWPLLRIKLSEAAPILPYLLLVLILIFRPKGLLGAREG